MLKNLKNNLRRIKSGEIDGTDFEFQVDKLASRSRTEELPSESKYPWSYEFN